MSEFFLELFSEEIPAGLQKDLREKSEEEVIIDNKAKEESAKAAD